MVTIKCENSNKSVSFFPNGGLSILVFAMQDGEYWFSIGNGYKTVAGAKRAAKKEMAKFGYRMNEKELERLVIA